MFTQGVSHFVAHDHCGFIVCELATIPDSAARMYLVGYAYTLSKRTELQVNYGKVDNKAEASYNVSGDGNDADRFGVGIRHTF